MSDQLIYVFFKKIYLFKLLLIQEKCKLYEGRDLVVLFLISLLHAILEF